MRKVRREDLKPKRDPLEGKKAGSIDWTAREATARAQMGKARARTLDGDAYRSQAPSTYRLGSKRGDGMYS